MFRTVSRHTVLIIGLLVLLQTCQAGSVSAGNDIRASNGSGGGHTRDLVNNPITPHLQKQAQVTPTRTTTYYFADRVINTADFAKLAAWGINTAVVDFDVNGSSSAWRAVFTSAASSKIDIVIWPSDWNDPRPNCGWEAPYPISMDGNIDKVKPLLDVASQYTNFIGIVNAHESFWTCDMSFDEMAGLKDKLKAYGLSKGRQIKVWNYIDNLYDESMLPYNQIDRIMDVAVTWQHCAGSVEGTCNTSSPTSALNMILDDRKRIADSGAQVELVFLMQTFTTDGYDTKFTLSQLQDYSCQFLNTSSLDGFGFYTWHAGWWPDLHNWPELQPAIEYVFNNCTNSPGVAWQVIQTGNILHIHYKSSADLPEYAALHLNDGYFRMNYGLSSGWGTSVLLMPAFWSGGTYYQGTPITADWHIDGSDLVLSINGSFASRIPNLFALHVSTTVRLTPPNKNSITAHVTTVTTITGTLELDSRPGEAFKPVMLSSMNISSTMWDMQSAYVDCRNYSPPQSGWFLPSPVNSKTFGLHGGTSTWKTNAPTVEVILDQSMPVTGWVTLSTDPNDDNIALWAASDQVLSTWSYDINTFSNIASPQPVSPVNGKLIRNNNPVLDWDEITDGTSYQVQLASDREFDHVLQEQQNGTSSYLVFPALDPNRQYYWRVQGCNAAGRASPWSSTRAFQTPLATPGTLYSPASDVHLLTLRPFFDWSDVQSSGYYTLQVSKKDDFTQIVLNETSLISSLMPGKDLPPATRLYWHVRSEGVGGTGIWSATHSFMTPNPPGIPVLMSPNRDDQATYSALLFRWHQVFVPRNTQFDHYQIQVSTDRAFSAPVIDENLTGLPTVLYIPTTSLSPNTQYYWRMRAFNTDNEFSSWSEIRSIITTPLVDNGRPHTLSMDPSIQLPEIINPVDKKNVETLQPVLDWRDMDGATSYIVQVSTDSTFAPTVLFVSATTVDSQYAFVKDAPPGVTLFWRVLTIQGDRISNWSTISTFRTPG